MTIFFQKPENVCLQHNKGTVEPVAWNLMGLDWILPSAVKQGPRLYRLERGVRDCRTWGLLWSRTLSSAPERPLFINVTWVFTTYLNSPRASARPPLLRVLWGRKVHLVWQVVMEDKRPGIQLGSEWTQTQQSKDCYIQSIWFHIGCDSRIQRLFNNMTKSQIMNGLGLESLQNLFL